jgi:hypothetical protein
MPRFTEIPDAEEYLTVKTIAQGIDVLSTDSLYPVSVWDLHRYLTENCEEARGEASSTFFKEKVAKALDRMVTTGMLNSKPQALRLTNQGRWSLLGKAKRGEPKPANRRLSDQAPSLFRPNEAKLTGLGVSIMTPELLMMMRNQKWSMKDFRRRVGRAAPTLLLVKLKNGTECGGVASAPWVKCGKGAPDDGTFIFSLGEHPARFDLIDRGHALYCGPHAFQFGFDLCVWATGWGCSSGGEGSYAGPRAKGQLVGGNQIEYSQQYESWELWRL